jgi:hypothetical protein
MLRYTPYITVDQQKQIIDCLCEEFHLHGEYYNDNLFYRALFYSKELPPGSNPLKFSCYWNRVFLNYAVHREIQFIVTHFGGVYDNSKTYKMCEGFLVDNQRQYYESNNKRFE